MIRTLLFICASLIILAGCIAPNNALRVTCWVIGVVVIKCIDYDRDITKL